MMPKLIYDLKQINRAPLPLTRLLNILKLLYEDEFEAAEEAAVQLLPSTVEIEIQSRKFHSLLTNFSDYIIGRLQFIFTLRDRPHG